MASRMFSSASSSVSPSDQQPGKPGTETLTPSSVRWSKTLYRIVTSASHDNRALRLQTSFRPSHDQAQNGTQKCGTHKCHPLSRNAQEQTGQGLWKSFSNLARSTGAGMGVSGMGVRLGFWFFVECLASMSSTGEMPRRFRIQFEGAIYHVMASASPSPTGR